MLLRSITLRNMESWAYAATLSVIFESSKHITGFGDRCGTPSAFMLPQHYTVTRYISKNATS